MMQKIISNNELIMIQVYRGDDYSEFKPESNNHNQWSSWSYMDLLILCLFTMNIWCFYFTKFKFQVASSYIMPISKSWNFDIDVLYFDSDVGYDIEFRYRSFMTLISKYLISQLFYIEVHWLRYRCASMCFDIEVS